MKTKAPQFVPVQRPFPAPTPADAAVRQAQLLEGRAQLLGRGTPQGAAAAEAAAAMLNEASRLQAQQQAAQAASIGRKS